MKVEAYLEVIAPRGLTHDLLVVVTPEAKAEQDPIVMGLGELLLKTADQASAVQVSRAIEYLSRLGQTGERLVFDQSILLEMHGIGRDVLHILARPAGEHAELYHLQTSTFLQLAEPIGLRPAPSRHLPAQWSSIARALPPFENEVQQMRGASERVLPGWHRRVRDWLLPVALHVDLAFLRGGRCALAYTYTSKTILEHMTLTNQGSKPLGPLDLRIELGEFAKSYQWLVPPLAAGDVLPVSEPMLPRFEFNDRLRFLAIPKRLRIKIRVNRFHLPLSHTMPDVTLLPADHWHVPTRDAALACFVMHNDPVVEEIVASSRTNLRRLHGTSMIEEVDPEHLQLVLKALYDCLQDKYYIRYTHDRVSDLGDFSEWQRVRLPPTVVGEHGARRDRFATCIDSAILFAACLEHVHRHPLIMLLDLGLDRNSGFAIQHALVGCWRRRESVFRDAVIQGDEDAELLKAMVAREEVLVLDTLGFLHDHYHFREYEGMSFTKASAAASRLVRDRPLVYALDVRMAREAGVGAFQSGFGGG